jgi:L-2-hydroxyglutarate oxidase LhgO
MSSLSHVQVCVIGAGVVGLAVARQLAMAGHEVLVLEKAERFGEGVSSRNSEVIHAGIYYPEGSLKAQLCVRGKALLYEYCSASGVGHRRIGKLIIANGPGEEAQLDDIVTRASANGVELEKVTPEFVKKHEPEVRASAAVLSTSTGIISAAELMTAFLADIEAHNGSIACHAEVLEIEPGSPGYRVACDIEGERYEFSCSLLVNSAGLGAQRIAASVAEFDRTLIPRLHLCKGNYFNLQGKNPFNHLIYPVPDPTGAGLGVHATIDLAGQVKFGPDVEYVNEESYLVSEQSLMQSYRAIRNYYPGLEDHQLQPGYAGIRPKLQGPGDAPRDFIIQDTSVHGMPGLINLFGIESPGLTSSMAIAETVAQRLADST